MHNPLLTYIKLTIYNTLLSERKRSRKRHKPGGPRTDLGALHQLDPGAFQAKISSAMTSTHGSVSDAAHELEVSPRTLYHYLDTDSSLSHIETSSELDHDSD